MRTPATVFSLLALLGVALPAQAQSPKPGDIVITEVLANPGGTISDANGEWFEIYNATNRAIDLQNWYVQDSSAAGIRPYHKIASTLVIQPYGFLVLGNTTNTTNNGGVTVHYAYGNALAFANSLDKIRIVAPTTNGVDWNVFTDTTGGVTPNPVPESLIIDRVRYASAAISAQNGISRELKNVGLHNHDIDGANWMDAPVSMVYGPGGRGTPGVPGSTEGMGTLPVELVSFSAALDDRDGVLAWTTASETGNAGFQVEHLAPGASAFRRVAFLPGRGTTSESNRYDYRVAALAPGRHAFRLRQVDMDGTATFSPTVELAVGAGSALALSAPQPNPSRGSAYVMLSGEAGQSVRVSIVDALGREVSVVYEGQIDASVRRDLVLETSGLPSGLYLVRAMSERGVATRPFTVAR